MIQVIGTASIVFSVVAVLEGLSDPSSMIVIIILVWKALSPIMGIYNALTRLKTVQASSQQIDALMSLADDRLNLEKSPPINYLYGNIELAGISHRYQGAQIGLTNLGFIINAGNTVTISGQPGSGRSTLLKIMAGIEANYQGVVLCEGYNIRQFNNYRYRSAVKFIPFDMHFFDATVMENFYFYNSQMRIEDMWFILEHFKIKDCLPNGLDTRLDPMFISHLSNGEYQLLRLAITLGDFTPGIVIIDEPLIGCCNEFTTLFTALISGPLKNKTVIMSTNEPSLIAASENCLLLDKEGAQKFYGSPDKVLDNLDK
jgi:ABC-type bacteriocin/lantibiotic exporter with double-glycine peptidase domain